MTLDDLDFDENRLDSSRLVFSTEVRLDLW